MHKFKKKFGQNFLRDENVLDKIVDSSNIESNSLVIEIGPGDGALTSKLSKKAKNVLAYEIDLELKETLDNKFNKTNVKIIYDDFLNRNVSEDIKEYDCEFVYVIANIPYYITTPIIEHIINSKIDTKKVILMVQKEVGERFSARPGTKDYSSITVYLNYYYNINKLFIVKRDSFYPVPNVDSIVISLERKKDEYEVKDENTFLKLIRDSFRFKRKTIKNNLYNYDLDIVEKVLEEHNFNLSSRAEQIDIKTFIDLSNQL